MEPVEPGALTPLQAARLDKGWKAAKLAAELGVSETTLSRWENGRQQPTLGHQQRLCEVLDKAPVELGFQEDILDVGTRREFMRQVTALVGTATMEAVLDIGDPDELDRFSLAVGHPTRVDRATVQHLEAVTATHRQLYHHLSSLELVDPVTGHLRGVTRLLRGAQHRLLRRRLAAIAGETAGHAAWLFHDLGDQKLTERYYAVAAIATRKAGDPALDAYVTGFKSLVRASDGEPTTALALARAARQAGARSGTATTRAWLAGLEAQALAGLHDNKACFVALRQAETAIGQARPDEDPPWMYALTTGGWPPWPAVATGSSVSSPRPSGPCRRRWRHRMRPAPAADPRRCLNWLSCNSRRRTSTRHAGSPPSPMRLPWRLARW